MTTTPIRFASFCSVSSEEQAEGVSLEQQLIDNRAFVANLSRQYQGHVGVIVAELEVVGSRRISDLHVAINKYPGYAKLVALIKERRIDAIVCRSRDRLGRRSSLLLTIQALCQDNDIIIVPRDNLPANLNAELHYSDDGRALIAAVESVLNEAEISRFVRRREAGIRRRVEQGQFPSHIPFGYMYQYGNGGSRTIAKSSDASTVRRIFADLYLREGLSMREIAELLTDEGVSSPAGGTVWSYSSVSGLFGRIERYAGYVRLRQKGTETVAKGDYEPILSDAEMAAVREVMHTRRHQRVSRGRIFTGVAVCSTCGEVMRSDYMLYTNAAGERVRYPAYRCHNRGCTAQVRIVESKLLDAVSETIDYIVNTMSPDDVIDTTDLLLDEMQRDLAKLNTESLALGERRQRIIRAYTELNAISETDFVAQMQRTDDAVTALQQRLIQTEARIERRQREGSKRDRVEEIKEAGKDILFNVEANPKAVNRFLRRHFRITVYPARSPDRLQIEII